MTRARRHPFLVDGCFAAFVVLFIGVFGPDRHTPARVALALVMTAALTVRRRYPIGAFVTVALAAALQFPLDVPAQVFDLALVIALYTVAANRSRRDALLALAVVELGVIASAFWWSDEPARGIFGPAVLAMAAVLLGDRMRLRRAYLSELEERAARLELERDQQAQIAAAAERSRIARELHDVVAHSLSVMVAQADGASYAIDTDLAKAKGAILSVAQTGRDALNEMRRLLGVLRTSEGESGVAPQPGVEQLGELVDSVRRAGLPVQLTLTGEPRPLPRGMELTAYRIVQEALTNTLKHGGANPRAWVTIEYRGEAVELRIDDDGAGTRGGARPRTGPGAGRHARARRRLRRVGAHERAPGWRLPCRRAAAVAGVVIDPAGAGMTIRILLVDDQPMLRMGFRMVLDAQPDLEVVGEAADGVEALAALERTPVDVVLMDVRMPRMDGVEATRRIAALPEPTPRVVILTTFDLDEYVFAGLRAGASAFLLKDVPPEELLHAIRVVASGDAIVAPSVTRRLLDQFVPHLPADAEAASTIGGAGRARRTR